MNIVGWVLLDTHTCKCISTHACNECQHILYTQAHTYAPTKGLNLFLYKFDDGVLGLLLFKPVERC